MLESVHCPKCATHYALRPPRVRSRHRRAKCFTCDHVFSIAEEVQRLMAEGPSPEAGQEAQYDYSDFQYQAGATVGVDAQDLSLQTGTTTGISEAELQAAFSDEAAVTAEVPCTTFRRSPFRTWKSPTAPRKEPWC